MVCEECDFCKHLHIKFRKVFIEVGSPKLNSFWSAVIKIAILEWKTSIRFRIFEMENFDEKNVVKKLEVWLDLSTLGPSGSLGP